MDLRRGRSARARSPELPITSWRSTSDPALGLNGRRVALTRLEYDLLSNLHERAGRPVPRVELLVEVWGHQWHGDGNVIEAALPALRRKLGDRAGLIQTVRGIGYRWSGP